MKIAAKIFIILSMIIKFILIVPVIVGGIALNKMKKGKPSVGVCVCTLIFTSVIGGIFMLISRKTSNYPVWVEEPKKKKGKKEKKQKKSKKEVKEEVADKSNIPETTETAETVEAIETATAAEADETIESEVVAEYADADKTVEPEMSTETAVQEDTCG